MQSISCFPTSACKDDAYLYRPSHERRGDEPSLGGEGYEFEEAGEGDGREMDVGSTDTKDVTDAGVDVDTGDSGYVTPSTVYGSGYETPSTIYGSGYVTPSTIYGSDYVTPSTDYGSYVTPSTVYGSDYVTPPTDYGSYVTPPTDYGSYVTPSTDYGSYVTPPTDYGSNNVTPSDSIPSVVSAVFDTPPIEYGTPIEYGNGTDEEDGYETPPTDSDYETPSTIYPSDDEDDDTWSTDDDNSSADDRTPSTDYRTPSTDYRTPSTDYRTPSTIYDRLSSNYRTPSTDYRTPSTIYNTPSADYGRAYETPSTIYDPTSSGYYALSERSSSPSSSSSSGESRIWASLPSSPSAHSGTFFTAPLGPSSSGSESESSGDCTWTDVSSSSSSSGDCTWTDLSSNTNSNSLRPASSASLSRSEEGITGSRVERVLAVLFRASEVGLEEAPVRSSREVRACEARMDSDSARRDSSGESGGRWSYVVDERFRLGPARWD